jgi:hypothetical protein
MPWPSRIAAKHVNIFGMRTLEAMEGFHTHEDLYLKGRNEPAYINSQETQLSTTPYKPS